MEVFHENPRKRLINELLKGKNSANQLQILLKQPNIVDHHGSVGSVLADELLVKIWTSFTQAITEVNANWGSNSKGLFQIEEVDQAESSDRKSKKDKQRGKDRRGSYKRRKTSDSWTKESATIEDGCTWRKYGQKNILNAKNPRCYYRCSHKYDEDCMAIKQVQIIQENPIIYQITYFGNHTCNSVLNSIMSKHEIISDYPIVEVNPKITIDSTHDDDDYTVKLEEGEEEEESNNKVQSDDVSSTMDSDYLWQDFMPSPISGHSSYFERVTSSEMEEFGKFGDLHFEAIEFS